MTMAAMLRYMTENCDNIEYSAVTNCGRKAERNITVLGLLAETKMASANLLCAGGTVIFVICASGT